MVFASNVLKYLWFSFSLSVLEYLLEIIQFYTNHLFWELLFEVTSQVSLIHAEYNCITDLFQIRTILNNENVISLIPFEKSKGEKKKIKIKNMTRYFFFFFFFLVLIFFIFLPRFIESISGDIVQLTIFWSEKKKAENKMWKVIE